MSETAGFISNNLSSSNSDFFSPTIKFKEKDSSNIIKDEIKLNDSDDKKEKSPNINIKIEVQKKLLEIILEMKIQMKILIQEIIGLIPIKKKIVKTII